MGACPARTKNPGLENEAGALGEPVDGTDRSAVASLTPFQGCQPGGSARA